MEFHQYVAASAKGKTNLKHLSLGTNMFDKPNKEASYLVIHFLFKKLNPSRVQDVFRHCWPVLDRKADAEFRKVTFGWLQEIVNEKGSNFPKVVASHLHSSSGPRFISFLFHLAKYVMVKTMKTFVTDGSWVPAAAAVPATSHEMEMKRFQMVKRRFQRVLLHQDALVRDYHKRARRLEKSLKDYKAEDVKYDDLLKTYENKTNLEKDFPENVQKVRSLWAEIDKLSRLERDVGVLASVMEGKVDQYVLDGKDINVKVPAVLLERTGRLSDQTSTGSLYEGGQPDVLQLIDLLNEGLRLLHEARGKFSGPIPQLGHQPLQEKALLMSRAKDKLKNIRCSLTSEYIPLVRSNIKKLELDWEKKWAECLSRTPLASFLNDDPLLDFISPMPPLSFEAASDVSFKASIFSQYPAKLSELVEQPLKEEPRLLERKIETEGDFSSGALPVEEKTEGTLYSGCFASPRPVSPCVVPKFTPACVKDSKRPLLSQTKMSAVKSRAQILDLEYENLASQFAESVTTSPVDGRRSGSMELEQLLGTLADPFTTKNQLPRTPERLLMEVRTSWRNAVEEGKAEKTHESLSSWVRRPISEFNEIIPGPGSFCLEDSAILNTFHLPCSPLPCLQGSSEHPTVARASQLEDQSFSIAHETFPDAENASFSCSESSQEAQEVEELLVPPVMPCSPEETACQMGRRPLNESPFAERFKETKSEFMQSALGTSPGLGSCSAEKVFSLDLSQLENFSSALQEEIPLPNLITFSPMDEL